MGKVSQYGLIFKLVRSNLHGLFRFLDGIPARVILYILSFTGFLVSFMMRTDMNMAMVAMARSRTALHTNTTAISIPSHCYVPDNDSVEAAAVSLTAAWNNHKLRNFYYYFYVLLE